VHPTQDLTKIQRSADWTEDIHIVSLTLSKKKDKEESGWNTRPSYIQYALSQQRYRGNNIVDQTHDTPNKDTNTEATTLWIEHTRLSYIPSELYSIWLMVEPIHITSIEAIWNILKQLRQIVILKSALNHDETAKNKPLKFGFLGSPLETARTLLTKC